MKIYSMINLMICMSRCHVSINLNNFLTNK